MLAANVRRLASPSLFTLFISSSTVLLKGFFQHAFLTNFFILNHMRWIDPRVNAIAADTAADNFAAEDPNRNLDPQQRNCVLSCLLQLHQPFDVLSIGLN
jgi:hypothetical protein